MDREQRSGWLLAIMTLVLVASMAFNMIYAKRTAEDLIEQGERRDCLTLAADIGAVEEAGKLTESGARVTQSRRDRYAEIGCEPALPAPSYTIVPAR